jgi:hypothetical protein
MTRRQYLNSVEVAFFVVKWEEPYLKDCGPNALTVTVSVLWYSTVFKFAQSYRLHKAIGEPSMYRSGPHRNTGDRMGEQTGTKLLIGLRKEG